MIINVDRLGRSLPDTRDVIEEPTHKNVMLSIGGAIPDQTDPVTRLLFNVVAKVAEFEPDLIRARTCEGMQVATAEGQLRTEPQVAQTRYVRLNSTSRAMA